MKFILIGVRTLHRNKEMQLKKFVHAPNYIHNQLTVGVVQVHQLYSRRLCYCCQLDDTWPMVNHGHDINHWLCILLCLSVIWHPYNCCYRSSCPIFHQGRQPLCLWILKDFLELEGGGVTNSKFCFMPIYPNPYTCVMLRYMPLVNLTLKGEA